MEKFSFIAMYFGVAVLAGLFVGFVVGWVILPKRSKTYSKLFEEAKKKELEAQLKLAIHQNMIRIIYDFRPSKEKESKSPE
ncbi:MAG TPA: hypothetical protein PKC14_04620 [Candidatus Absconditabacterales bacterium]|nr:hypothetical protein [Candidatus Absconditabacterales bacterium]